MRLPSLRRQRGRVDDPAIELQLLASVLRSVARDVHRAGPEMLDKAVARHIAARLRDSELALEAIRLQVAAAPYVGASGASVIEHEGEIYLVGAPVKDGPNYVEIEHNGDRYAVTHAFKDGQLVARPITRAGAS